MRKTMICYCKCNDDDDESSDGESGTTLADICGTHLCLFFPSYLIDLFFLSKGKASKQASKSRYYWIGSPNSVTQH